MGRIGLWTLSKYYLTHNTSILLMIPIIIHTHSEYSFLWPAAIPLLEKYAKGFPIVWCCDSLLDFKLPDSWTLYTYSKEAPWSERIKGCLQTIDSDYVIYLNEDMLLIDTLSEEKIEHCLEFMRTNNSEFVMSFVWNNRPGYINSKYKDYVFVKMFSHYIHPAIWKKTLLNELCSLKLNTNENESPQTYNITSKRNCYGLAHTKFQTELSTRSLFFPHMHAIYQGKWTFYRYPYLKALLESYGIDTTKRQVDDTWMVEYR